MRNTTDHGEWTKEQIAEEDKWIDGLNHNTMTRAHYGSTVRVKLRRYLTALETAQARAEKVEAALCSHDNCCGGYIPMNGIDAAPIQQRLDDAEVALEKAESDLDDERLRVAAAEASVKAAEKRHTLVCENLRNAGKANVQLLARADTAREALERQERNLQSALARAKKAEALLSPQRDAAQRSTRDSSLFLERAIKAEAECAEISSRLDRSRAERDVLMAQVKRHIDGVVKSELLQDREEWKSRAHKAGILCSQAKARCAELEAELEGHKSPRCDCERCVEKRMERLGITEQDVAETRITEDHKVR